MELIARSNTCVVVNRQGANLTLTRFKGRYWTPVGNAKELTCVEYWSTLDQQTTVRLICLDQQCTQWRVQGGTFAPDQHKPS